MRASRLKLKLRQPPNTRKPSRRDSGEARLWPIRAALAVGFAAALLGLAGLTWLAWALLDRPKVPHPGTISLHDTVSVLQLVFASVAGAGALVALIVAYRRQKIAEADSAHDRTRVFNERFTSIATQLGDDKPAAVRLAGVHAMAGLADDWKANRQTCIDVLCAYLRIPYEPDPGKSAPTPEQLAYRANREVRHTIIRVITTHLASDALVSWQGRNFDFTGVVFDGGSFAGATFADGSFEFGEAEFSSGEISFGGAKFSGGHVSFIGAKFSGATVDFSLAEFSGGSVNFLYSKVSGGKVTFPDAVLSNGGYINFNFAQISDGTLGFRQTKFSGGTVTFNSANFPGGTVDFTYAQFSGSTVDFSFAKFSGSTVEFNGAEFANGTVDFCSAKISGGEVGFIFAEFSGGTVDFNSAKFSGGTVDFGSAKFSNGEVNFVSAEFSGGKIDFSGVTEWSVPPTFNWRNRPPATEVKLPLVGPA